MKRVVLTALTFAVGVFLVWSFTLEGIVLGIPLVLLAIVAGVESLSRTVWKRVWKTA